MSTTLLIISDTHVPTRARQLPSRVLEAADAADLVIHAGDWIEASTLDLLESHAAFPDTDVLIFGHSHIPWDSITPSGLRLLNPGSPTDRRRQPYCTLRLGRREQVHTPERCRREYRVVPGPREPQPL